MKRMATVRSTIFLVPCVSTGAPGSGTEVKALRVLEAYGLDPDKDMKRDKLGASESAGALKDGKIDKAAPLRGPHSSGMV